MYIYISLLSIYIIIYNYYNRYKLYRSKSSEYKKCNILANLMVFNITIKIQGDRNKFGNTINSYVFILFYFLKFNHRRLTYEPAIKYLNTIIKNFA